MAKWRKPTLNIGQLVHIIAQVSNLTGHSVDDLIDMLFAGNISDSLKTVFMDTIERVKTEPAEVAINSLVYAALYKLAKNALGKYSNRIDLGIIYLKPI